MHFIPGIVSISVQGDHEISSQNLKGVRGDTYKRIRSSMEMPHEGVRGRCVGQSKQVGNVGLFWYTHCNVH